MAHPNILGSDPRPRFFAVDDVASLGLTPPAPRKSISLRTTVRSLAGMQKEALVVNSASDRAWRLVSDEGPYLAGHDEAPFPLAFLNAGTAASIMHELTALAAARDLPLADASVTLDNYYTMEGSAIKGTMIGGALAPDVRVEAAGLTTEQLRLLAADALEASPLHGLLRGEHTSLFTLTHNGRRLAADKVAELEGEALDDLTDSYDQTTVDGPDDAARLMERLGEAQRTEGQGGVNSSLQAEQKRTLHVRGICTVGDDGVKTIEVQLQQPIGSNFRFRSDEPVGAGGHARAPDAATLISAGIAFCFMTQFGRYAAITRKQLDRYRIVQDTHFSAGGASGGTGRAGEADPVETHVYLDTPEDETFARTLLDMGERTCFLHALCRTDLKAKLSVASPAERSA